MQDLAIFSIGHERIRWLAAHASATARNVANADTPGYVARDVPSFETALASQRNDVLITQSRHLSSRQMSTASLEPVPRAGATVKHSGNSVSLESEMANLGDARSQHATVTGLLAAFHRMLLASARG